MADYIIRQAFLTAYKNANSNANSKQSKDYLAGAALYDKAYEDLELLIFPVIGSTPEHREQWIKLVHTYFNKDQGGFWYTDEKWKEKAATKLLTKSDSASLKAYFKRIETSNFLQGGSNLQTVDLFKKLNEDMAHLLDDSPGISNYLYVLAINSHAKWQSVNNSTQSIDDATLTDHFNSMYNQMTGWLMDLYKGEPLYSKNGATIAKVKGLVADGSVLKKVQNLLKQTATSTGIDNSMLKANGFPEKEFVTEFENKFIYESSKKSEITPSQVLMELTDGSGAKSSPMPSAVLANQASTTPTVISNEPTVKSSGLNTEALTTQPSEEESGESEIMFAPSQTNPTQAAESNISSTQTNVNKAGAQTANSITNQTSVQNTTVNYPAAAGSDVLSAAATGPAPMSNDAAKAQLYIKLNGANWKESLSLRNDFLKLDLAKQIDLAQAYVKDPGALPNIIDVISGEKRRLTTEREEIKRKIKEEKLEKSSRILEEKAVKTKEADSKLVSSSPTDMVLRELSGMESAESDLANETGEVETKSPSKATENLVKTETKTQLRPEQAMSIMNPPNETKQAVEQLGSTIIKTSANTATEINKAVSNMKTTDASSISNQTNSQTSNSTIINQNQPEPSMAANKKEEDEKPGENSSGLAEFYLHAIYDALVGQGIKIRV